MSSRSWILPGALLGCLLALACGQTFVQDDDTTWYGEDDDTSTADDDASDDDDDATTDDDDATDDDDDGGDNQPPVADAGATIFIELGEVAEMDASASYDPDGDALAYLWEVTTEPPNGAAGLNHADQVVAYLAPTVSGVHHVLLTVTDPGGLSSEDELSVWVEAGNVEPIADAGPDQTVTQGDAVQLDGTASFDPNGDPLGYAWAVLSYPGASPPALSNPGDPMPNFVALDAGAYLLQLIVDDGALSSDPDEVSIVATASGDDDDGCFGCYAYMPGDVHPEPVRLSLTPAPTGGRAHGLPGLAALASACLATLAWHRRRS